DLTHRLYQSNIGNIAQNAIYGPTYGRIEVNRIENIHIGISVCNRTKCLAYALETTTEILAPMTSYENQPAIRTQIIILFPQSRGEIRIRLNTLLDCQQCVDNGVARDKNIIRIQSLC